MNADLLRLVDSDHDSILRVGCVQLAAGADMDANLAAAEAGFERACASGAKLVVLPEKWSLLGDAGVLLEHAEPLDGRAVSAVREWCRTRGVWSVAGSVAERVPGRERLSNTSLLVGPDGEIVASYRKIHMFDVEVGGVAYRESAAEEAGSELAVAPAAKGVPVGLTVCYDLRFPELHRILALRGAHLITVPAAFTLHTGKDHWEVLLRARAIENQLFVAAAGVIGDHGGGKVSYGRSMIVDPWGVVLAQAHDDECVIVADCDLRTLARVRERLPSLASRVPGAYVWPA
jgi:predicted amidohydrolase